MTDITILSAVLGLLGTVCAIVFSYSAFHRSRKKDDDNDGRESGTILTEIGYIKSGIDDIKRKQDKQEQQHIEVVSRLTAVEASAKQAHLRLNRLEGQPNRED